MAGLLKCNHCCKEILNSRVGIKVKSPRGYKNYHKICGLLIAIEAILKGLLRPSWAK